MAHYAEMAEQILRRAVSLAVPGMVLEFELLPAMTERPEWGAEITMLPCALRVTPTDIRELQLAKGAIATGFRMLLRRLGAGRETLTSIYLAGAFGNYVQIESAIRIGLIEAPRALIHAAVNTALGGAKMMMLSDGEPLLPRIEHVSLAADCTFQDEFADCMAFPEAANQILLAPQ